MPTNCILSGADVPESLVVAETIYEGATDDSTKMRYPVNSKMVFAARKLLPDSLFVKVVKGAVLKISFELRVQL